MAIQAAAVMTAAPAILEVISKLGGGQGNPTPPVDPTALAVVKTSTEAQENRPA